MTGTGTEEDVDRLNTKGTNQAATMHMLGRLCLFGAIITGHVLLVLAVVVFWPGGFFSSTQAVPAPFASGERREDLKRYVAELRQEGPVGEGESQALLADPAKYETCQGEGVTAVNSEARQRYLSFMKAQEASAVAKAPLTPEAKTKQRALLLLVAALFSGLLIGLAYFVTVDFSNAP